MIYNLLQYMENELPSYNFAVNGAHESSPKNLIIMNESPGTPSKWLPTNNLRVQFVSRAIDPVIAREQILDVFEKVNNKYGLVLPSIIINSKTYDSIKTYQMTPLQTPSFMGYDDNGLAQEVFNLQIITR